jgi:hypothetical protein
MIRTSILLPAALHKELEIASRQDGETVTGLIRYAVEHFMRARNSAKLKKLYETLREMEGMGDKHVTDASTTIDEVLYGEKGAWRGTMPEGE